MWTRLRGLAERAYRRHLRREIDTVPDHVAVIQDGNRRYARERGADAPEGHRAGANTTERVLDWCADLGVAELTLYAFSTENFSRPDEELEPLFDLLEEKLHEFADADRVHDQGVRVRAIGDVDRLPERVRDAVAYAERRTAENERFTLNVALAYGGRTELLDAARGIAHDVADGDLDPADVDVAAVEDRLYDRPVRDVDLIVRTGGDERTSNFLPWHANGNEAAVYFCAPYWPEFSEVDFLRAIRTYQAREESWQRARAERAVALIRALAAVELSEARDVAGRLRERIPQLDPEAGETEPWRLDGLDAEGSLADAEAPLVDAEAPLVDSEPIDADAETAD
ncbi:di-trans,poly-cis-decaprenylcistransferase [Halorubrum sp. CBA1125]|uniref:polyprenyl diphosphate synthase n=1 Tax=Halorubrum sp. CBA1125 TaxID=2668072 RepID=UPI0012E8E555|nr:polyprenyl diphosphate synthase [Halorubrum sp. CBA1125]MUW14050.1 di-trans,poly-cis-decaprenylcistransferase [Halorubrum sp. CBA1125]